MQAPREGMMVVVRNHRAMLTAVAPFNVGKQGRFHLMDVEYTDGFSVEANLVLWEVEPFTVLRSLECVLGERSAPFDLVVVAE